MESIRTTVSADRRLEELGIELPAAPTPFSNYVEVLQTENLLFVSGMLRAVDHKPKYLGVWAKSWRRKLDGTQLARLL
jgi:enamine deaminase RidA (YjgF/YER057c/UK114 family)